MHELQGIRKGIRWWFAIIRQNKAMAAGQSASLWQAGMI
jgi:hypothetical protein